MATATPWLAAHAVNASPARRRAPSRQERRARREQAHAHQVGDVEARFVDQVVRASSDIVTPEMRRLSV